MTPPITPEEAESPSRQGYRIGLLGSGPNPVSNSSEKSDDHLIASDLGALAITTEEGKPLCFTTDLGRRLVTIYAPQIN